MKMCSIFDVGRYHLHERLQVVVNKFRDAFVRMAIAGCDGTTGVTMFM